MDNKMVIKHSELEQFVKDNCQQLQMAIIETNEEDAEKQILSKLKEILRDIKEDKYDKYIPNFMRYQIDKIKEVINNKINNMKQIANESLTKMLSLEVCMEKKRNDANDLEDKIHIKDEEYVELNKIDKAFTEQLHQLVPVNSQYLHKYYNKYLL